MPASTSATGPTRTSAEAVANNLQAVGIRAKLRPLERAAFFSAYAEKKLKNIIQGSSGAFGNAATRLEAFGVTGGAYAYGGYPDIDGLFQEQAAELDRKRREATLHRIQQLVYDKVMYAPIWELAFLNGVGPRVQESGLGLISGHAYSAPYEDLTLKGGGGGGRITPGGGGPARPRPRRAERSVGQAPRGRRRIRLLGLRAAAWIAVLRAWADLSAVSAAPAGHPTEMR